jgi:hypothetical protein
MAAPKGNNFWELREKHGRPLHASFRTPESLWEVATEYFTWCRENPLMSVDFKGKDAIRVEMPHARPFTFHGLCLYIGLSTAQYQVHEKQATEDFQAVFARIRETIYNQKFELASVEMLNPLFISKDLGMKEQTETSVSGSIGLPPDQLTELAALIAGNAKKAAQE